MESAEPNADPGVGVLRASRPCAILDMFRVPYSIAPSAGPVDYLSPPTGDGPRLLWPSTAAGDLQAMRIAGINIRAHTVDEETARALLGSSSGPWKRESLVEARDEESSTWTLRAPDGSLFLPFDPNEAVDALLSETYVGGFSGRLAGLARRVYYAGRFVLPRSALLRLRRRFARIQQRTRFPRWPAEPSLHDLYALVLTEAERLAGQPLPTLAPWPRGHTWAFVTSHDVERAVGYGNIETLLRIERELGFRSAWYFVPERDYAVSAEVVTSLTHDGFEVGLHGLRHDGRDLNPQFFGRRLGQMQRHASDWGAVGFRAPATQRDPALIRRLGLEYDSSYSDVATFEPQRGGTCSVWPFMIGDVVELPITLEQDGTLLDVLGLSPQAMVDHWTQKAAFIRARGGLAMLLTHPDYMLTESRRAGYRTFLATVGDEAWRALPRDVSRWWRRRAETRIVADGRGGWKAVGPAADDARIVLGAARAAPLPPAV